MIEKLVLVAAGGAIGSVMRFLVGTALLRSAGPAFPWATLSVNVAGSFAMGVLAVLLVERAGASARWVPFLLTGVLGGFTTFSAFSLDAVALVERGRAVAAAVYVGGSVVSSVLALAAGAAIARGAAS